MNDRYLYRAKRIDNGELAEGYLIYDNTEGRYRIVIKLNYSTGTFIYAENAPRVDTNTICQCTGLKDKNANLIFEHDIVSDECGNMAEIIWNDAELQYLVDYEFEPMTLGEWCLVVGNIFDNPELLEVDNEAR